MIGGKLIILYLVLKMGNFGAIEATLRLFDENERVRSENLLAKFMIDLRERSFKKFDYRTLAVIGKNENYLRSVRVFFENYTPHILVTKISNEDRNLSQLNRNSVVLFFVEGFNNSEMDLVFRKLPRHFACQVLAISMNESTTDEFMAETLHSGKKMKTRNILFARFDGEAINVYKQRIAVTCERVLRLNDSWAEKNGFRSNDSIFGYDEKFNGRGCPMYVSTFESPPTMILSGDKYVSASVAEGTEGRLAQSIAENLNMTLDVRVPSVKESFTVSPDGQLLGIVGEVSREKAHLGIGQIRPSIRRAMAVDFSPGYGHECIVWTVPRVTRYRHSVIFSEFTFAAWIVILVLFLLCCGLTYLVPKSERDSRGFLNPCQVVAVTLNYAIPWNPSGTFWKFIFLAYLNYARVISTAYSASLSSILTGAGPEPSIVDEDGILEAGLRTGGSQGSLSVLNHQILANSKRTELIDRYEIITSVEEALRRINDQRDLAYLRHRSTVNYAAKLLSMKGEEINFYSFPDCVISYNAITVTRKGSSLTRHVDKFVVQMKEAGINTHWLNLELAAQLKVTNFQSASKNDALSRLGSVFVLYLCCLIPALLAFLTELVAFELNLDWFAD